MFNRKFFQCFLEVDASASIILPETFMIRLIFARLECPKFYVIATVAFCVVIIHEKKH